MTGPLWLQLGCKPSQENILNRRLQLMKIHLKLQQNIDCSHKDGKAKNETRIFRSDFKNGSRVFIRLLHQLKRL